MFLRNICFIAFSLVPGYPQVFACRHYLLQKCNTFWRSNPKENFEPQGTDNFSKARSDLANFQTKWRLCFSCSFKYFFA